MMKLKQKQLHGGGLGELGLNLGPDSWEWAWWKMVRSKQGRSYDMRPIRITAGYSVRGHKMPHNSATVKQHENEAALFKKATQRNWSWSRTIFATGKIHSTKDHETDYVECCKMLTWPKLKVLLNKFACMASQRQNSTEWLTLPPLGHRTNRR